MLTADRRHRERHGAAVLRAVGWSPTAEFRAHELRVGARTIATAVPYVTVDLTDADARRHRGVVDALGVRLRFSDRLLYDATEPEEVVARLVFDLLEQVRCESLVPTELAGVRNNIEFAFRAWNDEQETTESALGLLLYTVLHMARSRLVHPLQNERIEDTIEATRANISPLIGVPLGRLRELASDQRSFAESALEIARVIAAMVDGAVETTAMPVVEASRLFVPPKWLELDTDETAEQAVGDDDGQRRESSTVNRARGYHVFTNEHDVEVRGNELYPAETRQELRARLDELISAQAVSVYTLARRLQRLFAGREPDGWAVGRDQGVLDSQRLGQVVASPLHHDVFKQERYRATSPAVVSFLIDNSGSMKRQRHETVAVLVDTLSRALDLAGATSEVLGFTTASWNGGEALREWRRAGESDAPGRLAELCHIIYKDADTPWKRSRTSIASLMKTNHFRESIDGEAIGWAYQRLIARPEPRKLLVVVSDGAPMEAATMNANGESFLESHLIEMVGAIERPRASSSPVELGAIAVDRSVDAVFSKSVDIDLTATLRLADYTLLEQLFREGADKVAHW